MLSLLREHLVFAQAAVDITTGTGLPDWLPPVLVTNLALALLVIFANSKGVWVSGREHDNVTKAKDTAIQEMRDTHVAALKEINERHAAELLRSEQLRKEERDGRLSAEGRLGRAVEQMNRVAAQLAEIERKVAGASTSPPPAEGR